MTKPTFFAYARKSWIDPKSRQEIESTDRQVARLKAWAAEQGVELELFAEPDGRRSGGSTQHRPAYLQMLERLRSAQPGEVAGIVATELDRTGRKERDMYDLFDEIVSRGLRLVVLDDPSLNLDSTAGYFMAGMKVLLAGHERRQVGDRVKRALADKQSRGLHVGWAPYGYRYGEVVTSTGTARMLCPEPVEVERLTAILEKYAGGASTKEIARWANALGWPAARGGTWSTSSLYEIITNVLVYRGMLVTKNERREITSMQDGKHPAIIDEQLAQDVRARWNERSLRPRRGRRGMIEYPLVHLIYCAECGSHVVGNTRYEDHGKVYDPPRLYYKCHKDLKTCSSLRMDAVHIEMQVWNYVFTFERLLKAALSRAPHLADRVRRPLPVPSTTDTIRAEMDRLNRMYQKNRISEEQYDREYAVLERKLAADTHQVEQLVEKEVPLGLQEALAVMQDLRATLLANDRTKLPAIARGLISRVEVLDQAVVLVRMTPLLEQIGMLLGEVDLAVKLND